MKLRDKHWGLVVLVGVAFFLVFFRLDNSRLLPWDEAWYATIARNIYRTGDIFNLSFNGKVFWDHPPLGFILIGLSYLIFGISEFSARFPMALAGVLTVGLIYLTAFRLTGNKIAGLIAGIVLLSSRWFLIRTRTANLEALLLLTQLGVFYFSVTAKKYTDLFVLWLVFGLSLMTKSVISITLLPLVTVATFLVLKKEKVKRFDFLLPFVIVITPWYLVNLYKYGWSFFQRNVLEIAFRTKGGVRTGLAQISRTWLYFRSAVHKWYWPSILSAVWGVFKMTEAKYKWLLSYLLLTTVPYFFSPTTEIWHLLPMLPVVGLLIAYTTKSVGGCLPARTRGVFMWICLIGACVVGAVSIKSYWPTLYFDFSEAFEAKLAISSKKYGYPLYLQDTTYVPTVVFYSDRQVNLIWDDKNLVNTLKKPFQVITREHMLLDAKNFTVVDKAGDTVLAVFE